MKTHTPATPTSISTVHVLLLGAMAIWGMNLTAVKLLTGRLDVMVVATIRMVVAVVVLTLLLWSRRTLRATIAPRHLGGLLVCALLMVYANQVLFAEGLSRTSATNASLLMALSPLVASIIASVLLRERIGVRRLLGIAIGFAGVAAVILNRSEAAISGSSVGDLLLLASIGSFATGGVLVQRLSVGLSALEISWGVHLLGAMALTVHTVAGSHSSLRQLAHASVETWGLIVFSGAGATALAGIAWNHAISRIGVARTSMAFYWVPVFGLVFAAAALGEALTVWHGVGLAGAIFGSWLGTAERVMHRQQHH